MRPPSHAPPRPSQALGIRGLGVPPPPPARAAAARKRPRPRPAPAGPRPAPGSRRSGRLLGAPPEYAELSGSDEDNGDVAGAARRPDGARRSARLLHPSAAAPPPPADADADADDGPAGALPAAGRPAPPAPPPPAGLPADSVRRLAAAVASMAPLLGRRVLPPDGGGAMKLAALRRLSGGGAGPLRFSASLSASAAAAAGAAATLRAGAGCRSRPARPRPTDKYSGVQEARRGARRTTPCAARRRRPQPSSHPPSPA